MLEEHEAPKLIAVGLTTETGEIWQYIPEEDVLTNHRDAYIHLFVEWNHKDRWSFHSTSPRHFKTAGKPETITTAKSRTPDAIAKDIVTRLLPNARSVYAACLKATEEHQERQRITAEQVEALRPFCSWLRLEHDETSAQLSTRRGEWNTCGAEINLQYATYTKVEINNASIDQIKRILAIVTENQTQSETEGE